jgi:adenosylcobinamide-GDP ribazoletransferase
MSLRSFMYALQFLTRLPVPRVEGLSADDLPRSAPWFPLVGGIIGVAVGAALWAGAHASPSIGALCALLVWVVITGGLHLDGLGDVADALGAAHRSPERFLAVLRDPHIGAFGAMAIALQLIAKLVLLADLPVIGALPALVLVAAWARWGCRWFAAAAGGTGEQFASQIGWRIVAAEKLRWRAQRLAAAARGVARRAAVFTGTAPGRHDRVASAPASRSPGRRFLLAVAMSEADAPGGAELRFRSFGRRNRQGFLEPLPGSLRSRQAETNPSGMLGEPADVDAATPERERNSVRLHMAREPEQRCRADYLEAGRREQLIQSRAGELQRLARAFEPRLVGKRACADGQRRT